MLKKHIVFTISSRLGIVVSGFLVAVITARFLGPAGRGQYYYVITLTNLIYQLSSLGLQTSNTYLIAQQEHLLNKLILNNAWISVTVCGILSAAICLFLYYTSSTLNGFIWFVLLLSPLYAFFLYSINLMAGLHRINLFNGSQIMMNIITVLAVLIAGFISRNLYVILAAVCCGWLFMALFVFFKLHDKSVRVSPWFDLEVFKTGFFYALKSYVVLVCSFLVLRINVFFLNEFSSASQVGFFSVAAQISDIIGLFPMTVGVLLFPRLLQVEKNENSLAVMQAVLKKFTGLMLILCISVWLIAPYFIKIFFGAPFMASVHILSLMLPGSFFCAIFLVLAQYLYAKGIPAALLIIWILGVLLNSILSYALIIHYAAAGAAIALSISYGLILLATAFLVYTKKIAERIPPSEPRP